MDADLYAAASAGDIDGILKLQGKTDQVTKHNETILHLAAVSNKSSCVAAILDEFPNLLDKENSRNETALHLAAVKGYKDIAKVLIDKSGSLNSNGINHTSIDFVRKGNVDLDTALHLAVRNEHVDVVDLIIRADGDDEHSQNRNFETPLYLAAIAGNSEIVFTINNYCRNPGLDGPEGRTALHAAVISRDNAIVRDVMSERRDLYKRADNKGWTAFHYAASLNCEWALDTLIDWYDSEREVVMAMTSSNHKTAHHIAAYEGHIYVLTRLLQYCPEACEDVDEDGRNILHMAAEQSHKELIQSLLYDYPDIVAKLINVQDKNGNTPLHLLVMAGCFVPELIKHEKVNTTLKNNDNFSAQDLLYLDEDIVGDQLMIKNVFLDIHNHRKIVNSGPKQYLGFGLLDIRRGKGDESLVQHNKRRRKDAKFEIAKTKVMKEEVELYRARTNTQIIVTALIATVTFTVGFTMPGGNYGGGDANEGLAVLSKKAAFNVCMVANTIGLLFSASSLFLYFISSLYQDPHNVSKFIAVSTGFNIVSVVAMMLTFITGTYVVLSHSPALAISLCAISCLFFLLVILLLIKLKYDPKEKFKL